MIILTSTLALIGISCAVYFAMIIVDMQKEINAWREYHGIGNGYFKNL